MTFQYLCFKSKLNSYFIFKKITNGTYGYQINSFGTSVRIPLIFLTECHVTLIHGVILEFLGVMLN